MHRLIGIALGHHVAIEEVFQFVAQSQAVLEVVDSDDGQIRHEFFWLLNEIVDSTVLSELDHTKGRRSPLVLPKSLNLLPYLV